MDLKETLIFYRKRQGLSQVELAEALDVSRQTISKWETGTALPSAENLLALSKLYHVTADALLNGTPPGDVPPEAAPLPASLPAAPPAPEPILPPRRRLLSRMLAVVFLYDLLAFLMDTSLLSAVGSMGTNLFALLFRILGGCAIGLYFAWQARLWPVNRSVSQLIAVAALLLGLYVLLMPTPHLWNLYSFIVRYREYAELPSSPVCWFIGWTLCDSYAFFAHACLIALFQLGRLRFSGNRARADSRPQAVHQA